MSRRLALLALSALVLAGCGRTSPAQPARMLGSGSGTPVGGGRPAPGPPTDALPGLAGGAVQPQGGDPRVAAVLASVAQMRQAARGTDMRIALTCHMDSGKVTTAKSRVKYQTPGTMMLEITQSGTPNVAGTRILWKGGSQVTVRTRFVGFWVTVPIALTDERIRDDRGYSLEQTSIPRTLDTLLHPQARVSYRGESQLAGRPMDVLDVVSPVRLAPATREVYGIDRATRTPILREMYRGDKLYYRMAVDQVTLNPTFGAQDFTLE